MQITRKRLILGVLAAAAIAGASAIGVAVATDGDEQPLTGEAYDRAVAAALAHTGGGEVTETERGDDGAAYEVEIRLADGSQVEVHLDENFVVTGDEPDDDSGDESDD